MVLPQSSFGFPVAVHPQDPDTAWFAPAVKDEFRYPVDGRFVVAKTTDGGASFRLIDKGLPKETSYDLIYRHGLEVDETGERLAMGSTTGNLWLSEDGGRGLDRLWPPAADLCSQVRLKLPFAAGSQSDCDPWLRRPRSARLSPPGGPAAWAVHATAGLGRNWLMARQSATVRCWPQAPRAGARP